MTCTCMQTLIPGEILVNVTFVIIVYWPCSGLPQYHHYCLFLFNTGVVAFSLPALYGLEEDRGRRGVKVSPYQIMSLLSHHSLLWFLKDFSPPDCGWNRFPFINHATASEARQSILTLHKSTGTPLSTHFMFFVHTPASFLCVTLHQWIKHNSQT